MPLNDNKSATIFVMLKDTEWFIWFSFIMARKKLLFSWLEYSQGRIWHWFWWQKYSCHHSENLKKNISAANLTIYPFHHTDDRAILFASLHFRLLQDVLISWEQFRCLNTNAYIPHGICDIHDGLAHMWEGLRWLMPLFSQHLETKRSKPALDTQPQVPSVFKKSIFCN